MRDPDRVLERNVVDLPVTGSFGLTQGAYGSAGNLELLVPASDGGMHVLWHNADAPGTPVGPDGGPGPRCWSGALHVPADDSGAARVRSARITQVRTGPDALEATALTDTTARRLHWTPTAGFMPADVLATDAAAVSATVEAADGQLHVLVVRRDGTVLHCRAEPAGYPAVRWRYQDVVLSEQVDEAELSTDGGSVVAVLRCGPALRIHRWWHDRWQPEPAPTGTWLRIGPVADTVATVVGLDERGGVALAHRDSGWGPPVRLWPQLVPDAVAAAATTLDGGRLDLVVRIGDHLHHAWTVDGGAVWTEPRLIRSDVWLPPGAPVHRR